MKRDIVKYAEAGQKRVTDGYRMTLDEAAYLINLIHNNNIYDAISIAFNAGCEAGARAAMKRMSAARVAARG